MTTLANLRWERFTPLSNKTRAEFTSTGTIRFDVPSQSVCKPQYSYLMLRPRIYKRSGGANLPIYSDQNNNTFSTLSSNPVSCLFQKISFSSMSTKVAELNNVGEASQILSICNESMSQLNSSFSTNGVWWFSGTESVISTNNDNAITANSAILKFVNTHTFINQMKYGDYIKSSYRNPFACKRENILNWIPPLGVFNMPEEFYLPPNSTHEFNFTVEPNWKQCLIHGQSAANTGWTVQDDGQALVNDNIYVSIEDIALMVCFSDTYEKITRSITYESPDIECQKLSLQSNGNYSETMFTIPKGTYKVFLAFSDGRSNGGDTRWSPTNYGLYENTYAGNNILAILQTLSFTFNGNVYPRVPYDFTDGLASDAANFLSTSEDSNRAYQDFIFASDALLDSSGTILNYAEWTHQPIFAFKIINPAGSTSSIAKFNMRTTTGNLIPGNTNLVVLTLAKREVQYNYDSNGILNSIDYADLV